MLAEQFVPVQLAEVAVRIPLVHCPTEFSDSGRVITDRELLRGLSAFARAGPEGDRVRDGRFAAHALEVLVRLTFVSTHELVVLVCKDYFPTHLFDMVVISKKDGRVSNVRSVVGITSLLP